MSKKTAPKFKSGDVVWFDQQRLVVYPERYFDSLMASHQKRIPETTLCAFLNAGSMFVTQIPTEALKAGDPFGLLAQPCYGAQPCCPPTKKNRKR